MKGTIRVLTAVGCFLLQDFARAQIATDGSVGPAQVLTGPAFTIPQTLGTVSGGNLFHSFDTFNINTGESAAFTTTSSLNNVISRVTGGSASMINGALTLSPAIGSPDFYFINPAGVVFGAGASLNVPGAFHVGTADYIAFPDGEFHADLGQASTLTTAAPEAFGFLGNTRESLNVVNGAQLSLDNGSTLSLAGGDIEINNASVSNIGGGDVHIVAVGSTATEIPFSGVMPATDGNLDVLDEGQVYTESFGVADAGDVTVMAGDIVIDDQSGTATGTYIGTTAVAGSTGSGGTVDVTATGDLNIVNGGQINSNTYASGDSGSINLQVDNLYIDNQNSAFWYTGILGMANGGSTGNVGDITVWANSQVSVVNGSEISANTYASGLAGTVSVFAQNVLVDGLGSPYFTGIASNVNVGGSGDATGVYISAWDSVSIFEGGEIMSNTWGSGDAGIVYIDTDTLVIDRFGSPQITGIISNAEAGSTGNAGTVYIQATSDLNVLSGGEIGSNTFSVGNAGWVSLYAGDILLDGNGSTHFTGIASNADVGSSGLAGTVSVTASGALQILEGSEIASNTLGVGDAGVVLVEANDIYIDRDGSGAFTGIASNSAATSMGDAGLVSVTANNALFVMNGSEIASNTFSSGTAGYVVVNAGDVTMDSLGSAYFNGISSAAETGSTGDAGGVFLAATGDVEIYDGSAIVSNTQESGDAGTVTVEADNIYIDGFGNTQFTGIGTNAEFASTGDAGNVVVTAQGDITLLDGGIIASNTDGTGDAGFVSVTAGDILVDAPNTWMLTGIATIADSSSSGDAGLVSVTAEDITLLNGGVIASDTRASGDAGFVLVSAENIFIDGMSYASGITSSTNGTGNAGGVHVDVANDIFLLAGGVISSDNWFEGNAGSVTVLASDIYIDALFGLWTGISSDTVGNIGDAGFVSVTAGNSLTLVNDGAVSSVSYGQGDAGFVDVNANRIVLQDGGTIASDTLDAGDAGFVDVTANTLLITGESASYSSGITSKTLGTGDAGSVHVDVAGQLSLLDGGVILSDNQFEGNAGTVNVSAGNILIDTQGGSWTGISSDTLGAVGDAGSVVVNADNLLSIMNAGAISSDTYGDGIAGSVDVSAGTVRLDTGGFISAQAYIGSSGQTGDVVVTASDTVSLSSDARISIENDAFVVDPSLLIPTTLTVNAADIRLNNADITANSTGNVNASNIVVSFSDTLKLDAISGITTVAADGNGGSISIQGGDLVYLTDSQISTSVTGLLGNGGNIDFLAETLVMNTGFIQANTAAADASGGDVTVNVVNLFASYNSLFIGGRNAYTFQPGVPGFNVIQAVAPTGVSGNISISSPIVDLSGSMAGLTASVVDTGGLGRSPCQVNSGSSLAPTGRGGLPVSANGLARAETSPAVVPAMVAVAALPGVTDQKMADNAGCQFL